MGNRIFDLVKADRPKKNVFDLTHDVKLSLNMGDLVPICVLETVPGDKFSISCESLLRFAPLVSPVMHRMDVTMHYFFVPNRIINEEWETFITNKEAMPGVPSTLPCVSVNAATHTPLMDFMGIPKPGPGKEHKVNALPLMAYQMIYNEYYRDQNLIEPVGFQGPVGEKKAKFWAGGVYDLTDPTNSFLSVLRKRAWEHDYFTSALPFAQKGNAVELPLGDVTLKEDWNDESGQPQFVDSTGGFGGAGDLTQTGVGPLGQINVTGDSDTTAYDPKGTLEVGSTTINDLRRAFKLQEWLEKTARGGARYVENILMHFGVKSSDARLNRPEYITGTKSPVVISEIVNTTGTVDAPQGNMSGHAISVTNGKYGSYYCEEHGYIIGILSVMPKTAYQQGIPKHFLKTDDPFQYFWPSFAHIGEQAIEQRELYADSATPLATFGYIPRYAEYKFESNRVAGDFRESLDFWHMGRKFATDPALNQTFIECNPDDRIFAVTDPTVHKLYAHVVNQIKAVRPMPKFGTPTF